MWSVPVQGKCDTDYREDQPQSAKAIAEAQAQAGGVQLVAQQ